ncbi:hypothetical protein EJ02DRAFT_455539 [Clathrospora elynae]|uniref:Uncharacterized protein n=1 Tax=Clathrospora elynae TaxID=706981 RepID=A0A6A5SV73_9PLEO|nr:hypothetical protein EJ02DRAFT_455539 [Clathrospora elynae]
MASTRKRGPESDDKPQTSRKRTRRTSREALAVSHDDNSDYDAAPKAPRCTRRPTRKAIKAERLAAEVADLSPYNTSPVRRSRNQNAHATTGKEPPEPDGEEPATPRPSRPTRRAVTLSEKMCVQGAHLSKPTAKASRSKKRSIEEKMLAEVSKLTRWYGWESEPEDGSSDTDAEDENEPRSCARRYPPKVAGTQNLPWSELPGEIRNSIYEYAMVNENQKVLNVNHYPDGIPRRSIRGAISTTNFAHSYWGFTQACRQTRVEFTPWLRKMRRVRTALSSLNTYTDTFHRPDADGKRFGWIEPICCVAPLPGDGVEVLELLKHKHANPGFQLQLTPTTVSAALDAFAGPPDSNDFDELKIMRDMDGTFYKWWSSTVLHTTGITGIHIASIVKETDNSAKNFDDGEDSQHAVLIKLYMNPSKTGVMTHQKRLEYLNSFVFDSQLADKKNVSLEASFDTGVAMWRVRRPGVVDMRWKERKARGGKFFCRLTRDSSEVKGYTEESLD